MMQCMMISGMDYIGDVVCTMRAHHDQRKGIGIDVRMKSVEPEQQHRNTREFSQID
jgi:hypothetical protein